MSWYRTKVERDLARWQAAGWVSDTGAAAIRGDLDTHKGPFGAAAILAMLGAVLFGFAVMSFVAANWTAMPKLVRLLLLLGSLWAAYGAAAYLLARRLDAFAQAAILAGIAVYGASIMLIAQMYHLEGHAPDAVLYWALGALLAAVLARSNAGLAAAFVLLVVWTCYERIDSDVAHWGYLPVWAAAAAAAAWLAWRPGYHLAAIALILWLVPLGFHIYDRHMHWPVVLAGAAVAVAAALYAPAIDRRVIASQALFAYGVAVAFAGLYILQFIDVRYFDRVDAGEIRRLLLLAVVALAGLLAAILWSLRTDNRAALWIAYAAFALEIFSLYVRTLGSLLDTSLFFLIAALIVSGLAWAAYRLHLRKSPPREAAA